MKLLIESAKEKKFIIDKSPFFHLNYSIREKDNISEMETLILAREKPRQSYKQDNAFLYQEWAILYNLSWREREEFSRKCSEVLKYPVLAIRRIVNVINDIPNYNDWDILVANTNKLSTALEMGDSTYYTADSLVPLHELVKNISNERVLLYEEYNKLEDLIIPNKFQAMSNLKQKYTEEYHNRLREKKLYSKVVNHYDKLNDKQKEVVNNIMAGIQREYKDEFDRIQNRMTEIKNRQKEIEEFVANYS